MAPHETKTDEEYTAWLNRHPEGFVVNVKRTLSKGYFVLHRATCSTIHPERSGRNYRPGAFTQIDYRKFVADTVKELRDWGNAERFTNIREECSCMAQTSGAPSLKKTKMDGANFEVVWKAISTRMQRAQDVKEVIKTPGGNADNMITGVEPERILRYSSKSQSGKSSKVPKSLIRRMWQELVDGGRTSARGLVFAPSLFETTFEDINWCPEGNSSAIEWAGWEDVAPTTDPATLIERAAKLLKRGLFEPPTGRSEPTRVDRASSTFERDPNVVAWVLQRAGHSCECCEKEAPFFRTDDTPFLEVHHLRHLADGGPDTVVNSAGLCPNCHRRLHFGKDAASLSAALLTKVEALEMALAVIRETRREAFNSRQSTGG